MNKQVSISQEKQVRLTESTPDTIIRIAFKTILLGAIMFGLSIFDFFGLNLNQATLGAPIHQLTISMGQAVAISFLAVKSKMSGSELVLSLSLMYWVIVPFITALETMIFVADMPISTLWGLVVNGAIISVTISWLTVFIHDKWDHESSFGIVQSLRAFSTGEWIWKSVVIGAIYVLVYIASGALLFLPIAGDAIDLVYADLEMPDWILQFQFLRGIIWALATVPVLKSLEGKKWSIRLGIGVVYMLFVALLVIMPGGISVLQVQIAHLVELTIGHCLIFGMIVVYLFRNHHTLPFSRTE